jgi:hypothetical protein
MEKSAASRGFFGVVRNLSAFAATPFEGEFENLRRHSLEGIQPA